MKNKKPDFGGYATKYGLKCADGRNLKHGAFKQEDGKRVPLIWHHSYDGPRTVLGHADLEFREDGVYALGFFNETKSGKESKILVQHGDITRLSIHANNLIQQGSDVIHGVIREVSLVVSGANPGASIDNLEFVHADGSVAYDEEGQPILKEDEAIIHSGLEFDLLDGEIIHAEEEEPEEEPEEGKTVEDVLASMTEEQRTVTENLVGQALEENLEDPEEDDNDVEHDDLEGDDDMKHRNVFDQTQQENVGPSLTHAEFNGIIKSAEELGSFKKAFIEFAQEKFPDELQHADGDYGINNIDILFPEAKTIRDTPDLIKRRTEWVNILLSGANKSPFSRIKSIAADLTEDEARAKGYVTGNQKFEEVFPLMKRITEPTTIYKKQKLDRNDILDITDFNVVAWLKVEMRLMYEEELARACLIGDGRTITDRDKIDELKIRPIYTDADLYAVKVTLEGTKTVEQMDEILRSEEDYKGTGTPVLFVTPSFYYDMLLVRDAMGRRLFRTKADVAAELDVSDIIKVPVMKGITRTVEGQVKELKAIMVNMSDYTIGADKGGELNFFEDFDIDYNQQKYLYEGRNSGALTLPMSAMIYETDKAAG